MEVVPWKFFSSMRQFIKRYNEWKIACIRCVKYKFTYASVNLNYLCVKVSPLSLDDMVRGQ